MGMIAAKPADRFADAIEFIFALEHGTLHATPRQPRRRSIIERYPLRLWQAVAAVLALLLLASVALQTVSSCRSSSFRQKLRTARRGLQHRRLLGMSRTTATA
jgi:hypothetical protein